MKPLNWDGNPGTLLGKRLSITFQEGQKSISTQGFCLVVQHVNRMTEAGIVINCLSAFPGDVVQAMLIYRAEKWEFKIRLRQENYSTTLRADVKEVDG